MPYFFVKPLVWNDVGYVRPSGLGAGAGFPSETGFGGEEWNNADDGLVDAGEGPLRLFFTQPLGNAPVDDMAGDIVLLMTASHAGGQYLVGVAWGATYIGDHPDLAFYAGLVDSRRRREEAWSVPAVRARFAGRKRDFDALWKKDAPYPVNWKCPAEGFSWFPEPRLLDPLAITGKARLISMFGSYQSLTEDEAARALAGAVARPSPRDPVGEDLAALGRDAALKPTEREALAKARVGQGRFRSALLRRWGGCAVTGCTMDALLTASHVKPWRDATNAERLDPANGLLLVPTLDRLFDRGLITFGRDGAMLVSPLLPLAERKRLGLGGPLLSKLTKAGKAYMAHHRDSVFKRGVPTT